ncbi:hypothetical protein ACFFMP_06850 [Pseudoroseomonas cervicalis]|uniref:hypothetical protein n=2 Tax=Teichococcus cervicalis TaxID=204525 RepID=UPI0035EA05C5
MPLILILALVVLFPIGWLVSRALYRTLVAWTVGLCWLGWVGLALWRWWAGWGSEARRQGPREGGAAPQPAASAP